MNQLPVSNQTENNFGPPVEFKIRIPFNYNQDNYIDTLKQRIRGYKRAQFLPQWLTNKNYITASNNLMPGKAYGVKIFPVLERISMEECIVFLKNHQAVLSGAHGMALVYAMNFKQLPKDQCILFFDEKESLWKDEQGFHQIPGFEILSVGADDVQFMRADFESSTNDSKNYIARGKFSLFCLYKL